MTNDGDSDRGCDEFCGSTPQDWYVSTYDDSAVLDDPAGNGRSGEHFAPRLDALDPAAVLRRPVLRHLLRRRAPRRRGHAVPDVIQQVGAPAGGCTAVDDAALNWGSVKSGGWTSSWAEWADGGGGSVCTRTLHYDNGWTVTAAS